MTSLDAAGVAEQVCHGAARQDWPTVRLLLHPYLHWTDPAGRTIRGRNQVLDLLAKGAPAPPTAVEIRDGQIYRWSCPSATGEPAAETR